MEFSAMSDSERTFVGMNGTITLCFWHVGTNDAITFCDDGLTYYARESIINTVLPAMKTPGRTHIRQDRGFLWIEYREDVGSVVFHGSDMGYSPELVLSKEQADGITYWAENYVTKRGW